jgi:uncharacterized membrane-anchored protein YhcB (DUF1043 family)
MKGRGGGDASFLIGLVLGLAVGAAIAVILAEATKDDGFRLNESVGKAREALETKVDEASARIEGASEGAAPS